MRTVRSVTSSPRGLYPCDAVIDRRERRRGAAGGTLVGGPTEPQLPAVPLHAPRHEPIIPDAAHGHGAASNPWGVADGTTVRGIPRERPARQRVCARDFAPRTAT